MGNYCGVVPTQDQIDAFHAVLKQQAQQWINQVEQRLLAQVTALNTRITNSITSWFTRANAFVTSVKAQFDACVAKKDSEIASQKSCLKARIITQRTNLEAMLKKFADAHKLQFDKFYTCSFGENPTNANILSLKVYKTDCVDAKVAAVVTKFNKFWAIWEPKLIEHYTCGFKCTTPFTTPELKLRYSWNFCAPSCSTFRFCY